MCFFKKILYKGKKNINTKNIFYIQLIKKMNIFAVFCSFLCNKLIIRKKIKKSCKNIFVIKKNVLLLQFRFLQKITTKILYNFLNFNKNDKSRHC